MDKGFPGGDPGLAVLSFAYIAAVIAVAESVRRLCRLPPDVSRKTVHVAVAAWALPTALLFERGAWAALCPAVFVGLNALSYRYRLMPLIEEEGTGSPGTIYFPLSFALLIVALWPLEGGRAASVAGLYAMGFGDAAASAFGRRFGRRRYRVAGGYKSWEGTAAMFFASTAAIAAGTAPLLDEPAWIPAFGAGVVAAAAEAPAGKGLDNLTVPLAASAAWLLLFGIAG